MFNNGIESFETYSMIFLTLLSFRPWAVETKLLILKTKLNVVNVGPKGGPKQS